MRALRVLFAAVVAALSVVVVGAGPSFACSCATADTATHVKWADVVVTGTLLERVPPEKKRLMSSTDPATYVVAVDGVFKGEAAPVVEIRSHNDGASCGLELVAQNKRYVFFAGYTSKAKGEQRLWATLCGGSGPASPRLVAAVQAATGVADPEPDANGAAYDSELVITMDPEPEPEPAPEEDEDPLAEWAVPIGLAAGGPLVLLAGTLWLRYRLS